MPLFVSVKMFWAVLVAALTTVQVASGQTLDQTVEEITDAFNRQKTRGLVIVPSADDSLAGGDADTAIASAPKEYRPVAVKDQINLHVRFDFASAALRNDEKPKLIAVCEAMKNVDVSVFQIIGHTDSAGSAEYNQKLSLLRAKEVKRFLVGDCGIANKRLEVLGLGEAEPFNREEPRADENRRVELQALG